MPGGTTVPGGKPPIVAVLLPRSPGNPGVPVMTELPVLVMPLPAKIAKPAKLPSAGACAWPGAVDARRVWPRIPNATLSCRPTDVLKYASDVGLMNVIEHEPAPDRGCQITAPRNVSPPVQE